MFQFAFVGINAGGVNQVTFGAAGTGAGADVATPVSVPYPTGISGGNFLLLHVAAQHTGGNVPSFTTPSGWTLIDSRTAAFYGSAIYWKTATGSESGNQDVEFADSDLGAIGRMYRFSHGAATEAASGALDSTADTTATAINITTTVAKAMAVQAIAVFNNTTVAAMTGESGADYTEAVAEFSNAGGTLSLQVAEVATAATITGGTATLGASSADTVHGFAIKP